MMTNADLTLYNIRTDKTTKLPEYHRTQLKGIHWYTDQKVQLSDKGLKSADMFKIRIPEDVDSGGKAYVPPEEYRAMENVSGVWTIQNGDIFVRGLVDLGITKQSDVFERYKDSSGRVNSWSDNRQGGLPHFRIGGGA